MVQGALWQALRRDNRHRIIFGIGKLDEQTIESVAAQKEARISVISQLKLSV